MHVCWLASISLQFTRQSDSLSVMLSHFPSLLPVPGLERIAGPLEEVALHDHAIGCIHIEFQLGVIIRKVLQGEHMHKVSFHFHAK